jgi:hypothetical protein
VEAEDYLKRRVNMQSGVSMGAGVWSDRITPQAFYKTTAEKFFEDRDKLIELIQRVDVTDREVAESILREGFARP